MKNDKYRDVLSGYTGSIFQDFESYLRTEVDLVEDGVNWFKMNVNQDFSFKKNTGH